MTLTIASRKTSDEQVALGPQRGGRSRPKATRKFFDFSAGMPMPIISGRAMPARRRIGGRPPGLAIGRPAGARVARSCHGLRFG